MREISTYDRNGTRRLRSLRPQAKASIVDVVHVMRYLRVCLGNETGDPGMTLYEVDPSGWVHRQVQMSASGTRFAPEDILMCSPVNIEAMVDHPATEEITHEEFDLLWTELSASRQFLASIPDPTQFWIGAAEVHGRRIGLSWQPDGQGSVGWIRVPGFTRLFTDDPGSIRASCVVVFTSQRIDWSPAFALAA